MLMAPGLSVLTLPGLQESVCPQNGGFLIKISSSHCL